MAESIVSDVGLTAVADNWLLELAAITLEEEQHDPLVGSSSETSSEIPRPMRYLEGRSQVQQRRSREHLLAVLHLIDMIVLYERVAYDPKFSFVWTRVDTLQALSRVLLPLPVNSEDRELISDSQRGTEYDDIVSGGTFYYLSLSRALGADYWPAPRRAEFLARVSCEATGERVVMRLKGMVDGELSSIVDELEALLGKRGPIIFPGFGSAVLGATSSVNDLFPVVLEVRESKEAREFRNWLMELDQATQRGDLRSLARSARDIQDVVQDVRRGLGLDLRPAGGVSLQVGLSPSLTIDGRSLRSLVRHIRPKRMHVTFLRKHFERVLGAADVQANLLRILPSREDVPSTEYLSRHGGIEEPAPNQPPAPGGWRRR